MEAWKKYVPRYYERRLYNILRTAELIIYIILLCSIPGYDDPLQERPYHHFCIIFGIAQSQND